MWSVMSERAQLKGKVDITKYMHKDHKMAYQVHLLQSLQG